MSSLFDKPPCSCIEAQQMELSGESTVASDVSSQVLEQLVQHYNQKVHIVEERVPYFDPVLGQRRAEVPSIVSLWLDRLTKSRSQHDILRLILGYGTTVRKCLIEQSVGFVSVLQHYELLLSQLLISSQDPIEYELSAADGHRLSNQINLLVSDFAALTSESKFGFPPFVRCNIAIPTLVRIIHHCFTIVISQKGSHIFALDDKTLARCAVSLLAFGEERIDPILIAPQIFGSEDRTFQSICAYPPKDKPKAFLAKWLTLNSVNWESMYLNGAAWNDLTSGVQSRTADMVWLDLASLSQNDAVCYQDFLNYPREEKRKIRLQVMKSLGMEKVLEATRSHFFGKDHIFNESDENQLSTYTMMGKQVTRSQPSTKEKPYKSLSSRVYVALALVSYLNEEKSVSYQGLILNMLPVCLELVDSSNAAYIGLGSCALICLFGMTSRIGELAVHVDQALQVLDLAFGANRDGRVLILIGQCQTRLLSIAGTTSGRHRRSFTTKWLTLLRQVADGSGREFTAWEILVGGVIPLLYQHAQATNPDAIEVGRLGLSALLPLIGGNFVDTKLLVASLVGLINLMVGAYPMMVHHGGKILSHLLVATSELKQKENAEMKDPTTLALHTAALALAIVSEGGNSFGEQVLDKIEHNGEAYQSTILEVVAEVRHQAACLSK